MWEALSVSDPSFQTYLYAEEVDQSVVIVKYEEWQHVFCSAGTFSRSHLLVNIQIMAAAVESRLLDW
jgi:hypothetical protein